MQSGFKYAQYSINNGIQLYNTCKNEEEAMLMLSPNDKFCSMNF